MTPESAQAAPSPWSRTATRGVLIAAAAVGAAWVCYRLERLVFVLLVAMFFAYVVAPLVRIAERPVRLAGRQRRLPRGLAIGLVYAAILATAGAGTTLLLPTISDQLGRAAAQVPADAEATRRWALGWSRSYERSRIPVQVREGIDRSVAQVGDAAVGFAQASLVSIVGAAAYAPWLVLVPVLAFFFLKDADGFRREAVAALPLWIRRRAYGLFNNELNATLAAYVRAQLVACALIGCVCGVGFALLGLPYAALLGVLAGALEFVPLVGPLATAAVAALVAGLQAPLLALWVCGFLAALRLVQDYVVYPRLIRHGVHLHPLAVIVAVLAGVELGGIAGIFLAIPTAAVASVTYRHWVAWRDADEAPFGTTLPIPGDVDLAATPGATTAPFAIERAIN